MRLQQHQRSEKSREAFLSLLSRHLGGLYRYAQHVIRYYEALGDLAPASLRPEEVVDAVVLRAYSQLAGESRERSVRRRLIALTWQEVRREVSEQKIRSGLLSKEEDIPETPPNEEIYTQGEEIFEYWEPEEDLRLEDILPDFDSPTPEEEVEAQEAQWCAESALAGMPRKWRRLLTLRYRRGLQGEELAREAGMSADEAERVIEQARQMLRHKLEESGCSFQ